MSFFFVSGRLLFFFLTDLNSKPHTTDKAVTKDELKALHVNALVFFVFCFFKSLQD